MPVNPQIKSAFVNVLPREVRDSIYLELWRSCGLRQHILYHGEPKDHHFCHWPCSIEFDVQDPLQKELEEVRVRLGVPLGEDISRHSCPGIGRPYARYLQSPWMNHWPCGEVAYQKHGKGALPGFGTSGFTCWKKGCSGYENNAWSNPYLSMLLLCKTVSEECLQSIYRSTTFIFTDMPTMQMFFGYCELHPIVKTFPKIGTTPPALFKYARNVELSFGPDFPLQLLCANFDLPGIPRRHDVYDFHWLRLDRFENLQTFNIWIASRCSSNRTPSKYDALCGIKEFDTKSLRDRLAPFSLIGSVTISTPLSSRIAPEEGCVEDVALPGIRLYKRGSGDKFHPILGTVNPGGMYDDVIHTTTEMEVQLGYDGTNYILMKDG
ncbi:hypothetical protein CGLO_04937 [Colletotrichum gloeosporioides Cg-14]|uniref:Uncharacterized protein n=1 Tax=Colletotrichum gloeosporioides (strain Cg-14) TaxID=1237896 RepID=T0M315_COLGC|nr:hypothetical protein CGLO_04937 [Colletotrichum gloeosporioides Cg-14]